MNHVAVEADRVDVMRVLAAVESIRIRASDGSSSGNVSIANITMEVVDENTANVQISIIGSTKIEVCQCPDGYIGTSCEVHIFV